MESTDTGYVIEQPFVLTTAIVGQFWKHLSKQCFIHELVKDCGRYLLKHEIWKTDETFQIDFSNKDEENKDNLKEMSPAEKHQCNEYLRKFGLKLLDINIEQQSISLEKTNEH